MILVSCLLSCGMATKEDSKLESVNAFLEKAMKVN